MSGRIRFLTSADSNSHAAGSRYKNRTFHPTNQSDTIGPIRHHRTKTPEIFGPIRRHRTSSTVCSHLIIARSWVQSPPAPPSGQDLLIGSGRLRRIRSGRCGRCRRRRVEEWPLARSRISVASWSDLRSLWLTVTDGDGHPLGLFV